MESLPVFVSCLASLPVWTQMLPAFAYTIEPLKVTISGGTTITFEGAGVTSGPPIAPLPLLPLLPLALPMNGTCPWSRLSVPKATMSNPTIDRTGAIHRPADPMSRLRRPPAELVIGPAPRDRRPRRPRPPTQQPRDRESRRRPGDCPTL